MFEFDNGIYVYVMLILYDLWCFYCVLFGIVFDEIVSLFCVGYVVVVDLFCDVCVLCGMDVELFFVEIKCCIIVGFLDMIDGFKMFLFGLVFS